MTNKEEFDYLIHLIEPDEGKMMTNQTFCEYCNPDSDGYVKPLEENCHAFIRFGAKY